MEYDFYTRQSWGEAALGFWGVMVTLWDVPVVAAGVARGCSVSLWQSGTLKAALLDYTKRCRPGDSEKHNMIALCFSMCSDIHLRSK